RTNRRCQLPRAAVGSRMPEGRCAPASQFSRGRASPVPEENSSRERLMKATCTLMAAAIAVGVALFPPSNLRADDRAPAALAGQVSSDAEGAMEGVVVTARKNGSIVSVSVTSDAHGHYAFPENRLEPGEYKLSIRAVGYEIGTPTTAEIA